MFQAIFSMLRHPVRRAAFIVAAVVVIATIVSAALAPRPQVRVTMTPFSTSVEIDRLAVAPRDVDLDLISRSYTQGDLVIGGDLERLTKIYKKLKASRAPAREPSRSNRILHVAIVDAPIVMANSRGPAPHIGVDLKDAGDAAVLLVAEEPLIWSIRNASSDQRAKISVEGPAAFDVENAPAGLLADFRTGAFGAARTTSPADYVAFADHERAARLCGALRRWAELYDTPLSKIGIWLIKNSSELKVQQSGLSTSDWPQPRASDGQTKCSLHNFGFAHRRPQSSYGVPLSGKAQR